MTAGSAWVTGAGSGMGRASALAAARDGRPVALSGRRAQPHNVNPPTPPLRSFFPRVVLGSHGDRVRVVQYLATARVQSRPPSALSAQ